jgi:hypothetical protein
MGKWVVLEMDEKDHAMIRHAVQSLERLTSDHEVRLRFLERVIGFGIGALAVLKLLWDSLTK